MFQKVKFENQNTVNTHVVPTGSSQDMSTRENNHILITYPVIFCMTISITAVFLNP